MKRAHRLVITYGLLTVIGIVMVYPLLWMISASFKTNREIFSSLSLMPTEIPKAGRAADSTPLPPTLPTPLSW